MNSKQFAAAEIRAIENVLSTCNHAPEAELGFWKEIASEASGEFLAQCNAKIATLEVEYAEFLREGAEYQQDQDERARTTKTLWQIEQRRTR